MRRWAWMLGLLALWATVARAGNVGFEILSIPVPGDRPLAAAVWYPTDAPEAEMALGPSSQTVAKSAPITGRHHPLVVISHGTGGSYADHRDTAKALAQAGFVAVAISHTGDTYDDRSRTLRAAERPAQLVRALDYMTAEWPGRRALDTRRIGAFGFSSGGFTVLSAVGGEPDLSLLGPHCRAHPAFYDCNLQRQFPDQAFATGPVAHDPRIRAAVVAAPALGFTFAPSGLRKVRIPIQLWRAERDTVLPHPLYAEAVRTALPRPPEFHLVPGADHFDFLPPCSAALAKIAPPICATRIDRAAFHAQLNAEVVRFFRKTLR